MSEKLIELKNSRDTILTEVRCAEKAFYASFSNESLEKLSNAYKRLREADRLYRQESAVIQEQNWNEERFTRAINWLKQYREYKDGWIIQIFFTRSNEPTERVYSDSIIEIWHSENGYVDILGLTAEEIEKVECMFKLNDKSVITERPE